MELSRLAQQVRLMARMATRLPRFLADRPDLRDMHLSLRHGLARRNRAFLETLDMALQASPRSAYGQLLVHAGISIDDIRHRVEREGLEPTLEMLYREGVYVTHDEFKGRKPVRRGSLSFETRPHDFDNPLASAVFETRTGGSRSAGTRLFIDLDLLAHDAMYQALQSELFGLQNRPLFVWCAAPPFQSGMNEMLRCARLGVRPERWFAQSVPSLTNGTFRHALFTKGVRSIANRCGASLPAPENTPLDQAVRVAGSLANALEDGRQPVLRANVSSAVRVCLAADAAGIDIAGSFMRVSAEPFTPGKAAIIREAGCAAAPWYASGEAGIIGMACGNPAEPDEVHLMTDKLAMIEITREVPFAAALPVMCLTSISPVTPKLLLNYVSDDFARVGTRSCGCLLDQLGYAVHASEIRSWEKLTSEGMSFAGRDLIRIVEEVLPGRFGGTAIDYQFVEVERAGLTSVDLRVSPRLGSLDEAAVRHQVLGELDNLAGTASNWADRWRQADTLTVVREEPAATAASKVLALHVARSALDASSGEANRPAQLR